MSFNSGIKIKQELVSKSCDDEKKSILNSKYKNSNYNRDITNSRDGLIQNDWRSHRTHHHKDIGMEAHDDKKSDWFGKGRINYFGRDSRYKKDYIYPGPPTRDNRENINSSMASIPEVSSDVKIFWSQLKDKLENRHEGYHLPFNFKNSSEIDLWFRCWTAAAAGASGPVSVLPKILMLLPAAALTTPPIDIVLKVLLLSVRAIIVDTNIKSHKRGYQYCAPTRSIEYNDVALLESIADIVRDRLNVFMNPINCIEDALQLLEDLEDGFRTVVIQLISAKNKQLQSRLATLLKRADEIEKFKEDISQKNLTDPVLDQLTDDQEKCWLGWRDCSTVGWLMSGNWHIAPELKSIYSSPENYAESLLRIWTLLSFYWGTGAVWPRCSHRQGSASGSGSGSSDMPCGEPLLSHSNHYTCTMRKGGGRHCGAAANWQCHRYGHDAICNNCLRTTQNSLIGPPGPAASTDIYDAIVQSENTRNEGTVYTLSSLSSRKPPKIAPNWKTTYRLQPSALVGIVKLSVWGEPLRKQYPIQWAEIVPMDVKKGGWDDHLSRANGYIALRILSRNDCSALSSDSDNPLGLDTRVAIIDLRVFVPEVVSVLSTFVNDSFIPQIKQIPFIDQLLGRSVQPHPLHNLTVSNDIQYVVSQAISRSQIEVLQRLDADQKDNLVRKICAQRHVKSLYGTQLEAFAAGLSCAIHCTQGPPGTGKSYVGVCLVTSLDLIRQEAAAAGHPLGPVLMLSYKNHALDEFLLDVIKYSYSLKPGMLIRSGKPEHPALSQYAERGSYVERAAADLLTERVATLRRARGAVKTWREGSGWLESLCLSEQAVGNHHHQETTSMLAKLREPFELAIAICVKLYVEKSEKSALSNPPSTFAFNQMYDTSTKSLSEKAYNTLSSLKSSGKQLLFSDHDLRVEWPVEGFVDGLWRASSHWVLDRSASERDQSLAAAFPTLFILEKWLLGLNPPPRCRASGGEVGESCQEIAIQENGYCQLLHACLSRFGCNDRRVLGDVPFCDRHFCQSDDDGFLCSQERIENSEFCAHHSCVYCIISGARPICRKEGTACRAHRCQAAGNQGQCKEAQLLPHKFCRSHICGVCGRSGIVTDCPALANNLCVVHRCAIHNCRESTFGPNSKFCAVHICRACAPGAITGVDVTCAKSRLCANHRCRHPDYDCQHIKFYASPYFCIAHTCRVCLDLDLPAQGPVEDDHPRNHCLRHPLCSFTFPRGGPCNAVAIPNGYYCINHSSTHSSRKRMDMLNLRLKGGGIGDGQCWGVTKKKGRCSRKGSSSTGGKWYCHDHAHLAPGGNEGDVDVIIGQDNIAENEEEKRLRELNANSIIAVDNNANLISSQLSLEAQISHTNCEMLFHQLPRFQRRFKLLSCAGVFYANNDDVVIPCATTILSDTPTEEWYCPLHCHDALYPTLRGNSNDRKSLDGELEDASDDITVEGGGKADDRQTNISADLQRHHSVTLDAANNQNNIGECIIGENTDDDDDFMDAVAGDVHPDELDFIPEEENDNQRRLREMVDDENDDDDDDDADAVSEDSFFAENDEFVKTFAQMKLDSAAANDGPEDEITSLLHVKNWSWEMTCAERWSSVAAILRGMGNAVSKLRVESEGFVAEARRNKAEASAQVYRSAKIIGATVVGASRRLEAIRAAEPFAVVVEEACEVMEPTLMAVLAVKSLRKLELVGDHRQLPAFIQNCWFNLETSLPSIKTSLFERLISGKVESSWRGGGGAHQTADAADPAPSTVLDEQRRMRRCIADLTRLHYEDIVVIKDHAHTKAQTIGSSLSNKYADREIVNKFLDHKKLWLDKKGRQIPGMATSVYFWNISGNKESRSAVGLSASNELEASAAAGLTKWLLCCGVPASSISIITPYKGQKNVIISALYRTGCLPPYQRDQPPVPPGTTVMVSTVDRYQGDENDVVILSLVRTQPGNRFVGLLNRFIVAMSRARLGFYIIGSVNAVVKNRQGGKGPVHWNRLVDHLRSPSSATRSNRRCTTRTLRKESAPEETKQAMVSADVSRWDYIEPDAKIDDEATCSENTPGNLNGTQDTVIDCEEEDVDCEEADEAQVVDGDDDDDDTSYTGSRVNEFLPVCCPYHAKSSSRKVVNAASFPVVDAWNEFCKEKCSYIQPNCHHQCQLLCHSPTFTLHTQYCQELIPRPCDQHLHIDLRCGELGLKPREDIIGGIARFRCTIAVNYSRSECEHIQEMLCHNKKALDEDDYSLPDCEVVVGDFIHPRCNHSIASPKCKDRRRYENKPPDCETVVKYQRKCGCISEMLCWVAVREGEQSNQCQSSVERKRPRCSHLYSLRCYVASDITDRWNDADGNAATVEGNMTLVEEGLAYGPSETELCTSVPTCAVPVRYTRTCGHTESFPCDVAFRTAAGQVALTKCCEEVSFDSPLCGHGITSPCWAAVVLQPWRPWGLAGLPPPSPDNRLVIPEGLLALANVEGLDLQFLKMLRNSCSCNVYIARTCGADHVTTVKCKKLLPLLLKKMTLPDCLANVEWVLPCRHTVRTKCFRKSSTPPICKVSVDDVYTYPCGLHSTKPGSCARLQVLRSEPQPLCPEVVSCERYRCGHSVSVPCYLREEVTKATHGERGGDAAAAAGQIVVYSDKPYCSESNNIPECDQLVSYCYPCGHIRTDVLCKEAFDWALDITTAPACMEEVDCLSPLCLHSVRCPCAMTHSLQAWSPWEGREMPDKAISRGMKEVTGEVIMCREIKWNDPRPKDIPYLNLDKYLQCKEAAVLLRECGHTSNISCKDAYLKNYPNCTEKVLLVCSKEGCRHETLTACHVHQEAVKQGNEVVVFTCMNRVSKLCSVCHINRVETECYREMPECRAAARVTRACGHEAVWICGTEEDPRCDSHSLCRRCIMPLWREAVDYECRSEDCDRLEALLRADVTERLQQLGDVTRLIPTDVHEAILTHIDVGRRSIHKVNYELMLTSDKATLLTPPAAVIGSVDDRINYKIVFQPATGNSKHVMKDAADETQVLPLAARAFTNISPTHHGPGVLLRNLTTNNVGTCKPSEDGTVTICVGVTYSRHCANNIPPFRKSESQKAKQHARKTSLDFVKKGVDSVRLTDNAVPGTTKGKGQNNNPPDTDADNGDAEYICWVPGATLPLFLVTLQLHIPCGICREPFTASNGYICSNRHFICYETCFSAYVASASQPDAAGRSVDKDGSLKCPQCDEVFDLQNVTSKEACEQLLNLRIKIHSEKMLKEGLEEQRAQLQAEFDRILAIQNIDEKDAELARLYIIDEILMLRCPRCRGVFVDFEGCFALTCTCKACFCAWCLADCGDNAHPHVRQCPHKPAGVDAYFGTKAQFEEHHRSRREELVNQKYRSERPEVKKRLKRLLENDVRDLKINLEAL